VNLKRIIFVSFLSLITLQAYEAKAVTFFCKATSFSSFGAVVYDKIDYDSTNCYTHYPTKEWTETHTPGINIKITGLGPSIRINKSNFMLSCPFLSYKYMYRKINNWMEDRDDNSKFGPVLAVGVKVSASAVAGASVGVYMSGRGPCFLTGLDLGIGASVTASQIKINRSRAGNLRDYYGF
jgi:hypothetical protein